jgi:hypothetical protein
MHLAAANNSTNGTHMLYRSHTINAATANSKESSLVVISPRGSVCHQRYCPIMWRCCCTASWAKTLISQQANSH